MIKIVTFFSTLTLCWANLQEFPNVDIEGSCFGSKHVKVPSTMNDKFTDLLAIAQGRIDKKTPKNHDKIVIHDKFSKDNPTWGEVTNFVFRWHSTYLEKFQNGLISKNEMYPENEKVIKHMLKEFATLPITYIEPTFPPTDDFKLYMWFERGIRTVFKPQRAKREEQAHPDHFYFDDFERHNAEIAAYHLDRILGFRRAVPQVGRYVNLMEEIAELADDDLFNTFYISPAGNNCLMGSCKLYCDTNHAVCGNPNIIEASFGASLPINGTDLATDTFVHPWKRSFDKRRKASWEVDDKYCEKIRAMPPFNAGRRLLDIMDLAVMDFLVGNMARKNYELFKEMFFGNDSFMIHSDFGRGFTRAYHDEVSILAPIKQCCMIRSSTLKTLISFHTGSEKLSAALRSAMSSDPLSPLLWEPHLAAIDRRVAIILETVRGCLSKK